MALTTKEVQKNNLIKKEKSEVDKRNERLTNKILALGKGMSCHDFTRLLFKISEQAEKVSSMP